MVFFAKSMKISDQNFISNLVAELQPASLLKNELWHCFKGFNYFSEKPLAKMW